MSRRRLEIERQFDELKDSGQLPSPSNVGLQILCLTQEDDFELDDLARVIQTDPALTGRILKVANSVGSGPSALISTVGEAAMRLGARSVSNVALGFSLISSQRAGDCPEFDYDRFWSLSLARAVAAKAVSAQTGLAHPAEAYTCGLLAEIGLLALASVHPIEFGVLLQSVEGDEDERALIELEHERFRIDHDQITEALIVDWGLPEHFGRAARLHRAFSSERRSACEERATSEMLTVLRQADLLARYCTADETGRAALLGALEALRGEWRCTPPQFDEVCDAIGLEWREWGRALAVPTLEVPPLVEIRRAHGGPQPLDASGLPVESDDAPLRVLAVDDDRASLRRLQKQLESAGHEVLVAADGKEGLAKALKFDPHIVITDWMMPGMDGVDLCKALRRFQAGRNMYILLLTGRSEEDRVVEAFEAGVDDYIVKPFNPRLLLARVRAGKRVVRLQERVEKDKRIQREQVSRLAVMTRQLRAAAQTDALTELPNRRYAMGRLQEEWENARRSRLDLSVVMIDVDYFKRVNDTYGHHVGDFVLQRTARCLQDTVRDGDVVCRMGGEEFLVLCPRTGLEGAEQCAQRARAAVEANEVEALGFRGAVTISAGVGVLDASMSSVDELLKTADEAVYAAKDAGRNQVRIGGGGSPRALSA